MSSLDDSPIDGDAAVRAEYAAALIARGVSREDAQALAARTQYLPQAAWAAKPSARAGALLPPDTPQKVLSARDAKLLEAGVAIAQDPPDWNELIFHHSILCQTGLPRRKVKEREFQRRVGSAWLHLQAGILSIAGVPVPQPIPYGATPRLALACIATLALRSSSPAIEIGRTPADFMRLIGLADTQGDRYKTLRCQLNAMAACRLQMGFADHTFNSMAVKQYEAWLPRSAGELNKWPNVLVLTDDFYKELRAHGVPLDRRALHALTGSALCIDIYTWLAYRLHLIKGSPVTVPWAALRLQFGQEYCGVRAEDDFRTSFLLALPKVLAEYPQAKVTRYPGGLKLHASPPPVQPRVFGMSPPRRPRCERSGA